MKTQSRTEYLMECLAYHERRLKEEENRHAFEPLATIETYHQRQIRWFLKKLSEPVRSTPSDADNFRTSRGYEMPDFDKPFRDSLPKIDYTINPYNKSPNEEAGVNALQELEADKLIAKRLEEFNKRVSGVFYNELYLESTCSTQPSSPKPTFFSRLWNVFKRK